MDLAAKRANLCRKRPHVCTIIELHFRRVSERIVCFDGNVCVSCTFGEEYVLQPRVSCGFQNTVRGVESKRVRRSVFGEAIKVTSNRAW